MFCKNCGNENCDQAVVCVHCGASLQQEAPATAQPQQTMIPIAYKPLGAWMYFALSLLFSVPIVGLVFLIIFSLDDSNLNRRNFARSYWCSMIVGVGIFILLMIFLLVFGFTFADAFSEMMYY
ncbi:MAG: hypothetical protein IJO92_01435 [Clostridia bacterium]|nr:hypothetical protein [Clostridia bacterium]